ncbi:hypothetical protein ACQPWY_31185 [Pseudonocardia xinjiangensis]|uniref:hypothetical protein n=1 Tax=Pseudonocardia xinjiangensis TaxID=75289 RepID=UPI003D8ECB01
MDRGLDRPGLDLLLLCRQRSLGLRQRTVPLDDLVHQLGPIGRQLGTVGLDRLHQILVRGLVFGVGRLAHRAGGDLLLLGRKGLRALVHLDLAVEHTLGLLLRVLIGLPLPRAAHPAVMRGPARIRSRGHPGAQRGGIAGDRQDLPSS